MSNALDQLAEVIGCTNCFALVGAYGGEKIYLPEHVRQANPVAKLIGIEAARNLSLWLAGKNFLVPMPKAYEKTRKAVEAYDQYTRLGLDAYQIADGLGVSPPTARKLVDFGKAIALKNHAAIAETCADLDESGSSPAGDKSGAANADGKRRRRRRKERKKAETPTSQDLS